ncbi:hypothetical protein B0H15DRAFT_953923 [Mycena belliarum]|uniref:Uncharacterized protein n=1 Tax=Mycena belliarum TaxID=1033014 RepID=A0AAD6TW58_9AGAR|nr:hypothetical protein B0H15DRAFT_953923 [Mycena belliae]
MAARDSARPGQTPWQPRVGLGAARLRSAPAQCSRELRRKAPPQIRTPPASVRKSARLGLAAADSMRWRLLARARKFEPRLQVYAAVAWIRLRAARCGVFLGAGLDSQRSATANCRAEPRVRKPMWRSPGSRSDRRSAAASCGAEPRVRKSWRHVRKPPWRSPASDSGSVRDSQRTDSMRAEALVSPVRPQSTRRTPIGPGAARCGDSRAS